MDSYFTLLSLSLVENYHISIFTTFEKQSMINRLSNPINRNRSAAKISKVMSSSIIPIKTRLREMLSFIITPTKSLLKEILSFILSTKVLVRQDWSDIRLLSRIAISHPAGPISARSPYLSDRLDVIANLNSSLSQKSQ